MEIDAIRQAVARWRQHLRRASWPGISRNTIYRKLRWAKPAYVVAAQPGILHLAPHALPVERAARPHLAGDGRGTCSSAGSTGCTSPSPTARAAADPIAFT
ncbi:MAG: hypothetical protein U1F56_13875 [Rubrivivax sp.]